MITRQIPARIPIIVAATFVLPAPNQTVGTAS